jgi:hypothetical protein
LSKKLSASITAALFVDTNVYLVVDEAPLFEESVDADDGADISGKVPAARGAAEIIFFDFFRVFSRGNHCEIPRKHLFSAENLSAFFSRGNHCEIPRKKVPAPCGAAELIYFSNLFFREKLLLRFFHREIIVTFCGNISFSAEKRYDKLSH